MWRTTADPKRDETLREGRVRVAMRRGKVREPGTLSEAPTGAIPARAPPRNRTGYDLPECIRKRRPRAAKRALLGFPSKAHEVGDNLLSRGAVSSASRASLLCSGWEQVLPRLHGHRQDLACEISHARRKRSCRDPHLRMREPSTSRNSFNEQPGQTIALPAPSERGQRDQAFDR